jgi:hypothetical protein
LVGLGFNEAQIIPRSIECLYSRVGWIAGFHIVPVFLIQCNIILMSRLSERVFEANTTFRSKKEAVILPHTIHTNS